MEEGIIFHPPIYMLRQKYYSGFKKELKMKEYVSKKQQDK